VAPEREDVAGDVAAAVLDALKEEVAAELMMMMMTTTVTRMGQPWTLCG
jgi:flagellar motility protein MotE (MotC chaperone)